MRKLRCWPGCLAIIVRDIDSPENVGVFVKVIERVHPEDDYPVPGLEDPDADWSCESAMPVRVWNEDGTSGLSQDILMPDAQLQPITPPPATKDTPTDVPESAEV